MIEGQDGTEAASGLRGTRIRMLDSHAQGNVRRNLRVPGQWLAAADAPGRFVGSFSPAAQGMHAVGARMAALLQIRDLYCLHPQHSTLVGSLPSPPRRP